MYGNAVVTAITVAIGDNGFKIAYFSHSARAQRTVRPLEICATGAWGPLKAIPAN